MHLILNNYWNYKTLIPFIANCIIYNVNILNRIKKCRCTPGNICTIAPDIETSIMSSKRASSAGHPLEEETDVAYRKSTFVTKKPSGVKVTEE